MPLNWVRGQLLDALGHHGTGQRGRSCPRGPPLHLTPARGKVFREIHRVLRPGGRLQIADIVVQKDLPPEARDQVDIWTA